MTDILKKEDSNFPFLKEYPVIEEKLAVDLSQGVRAAEKGLLAFRARPLLTRLWEGLTGKGQERVATIGGDLLRVQKATIDLLGVLMQEQGRTQYCIEKVIGNLIGVNLDLDCLQKAHEASIIEFNQKLDAIRTELYSEIRKTAVELVKQLGKLDFRIEREARLRRNRDLFMAGEIYPGIPPLLRAALFLAQNLIEFSSETKERQLEEWKAIKAFVKTTLPGSVSPYFQQLMIASKATKEESLEVLEYFSSNVDSPNLMILSKMYERLSAKVSMSDEMGLEIYKMVKLRNSHRIFPCDQLYYDYELAAIIAEEFVLSGYGKF